MDPRAPQRTSTKVYGRKNYLTLAQKNPPRIAREPQGPQRPRQKSPRGPQGPPRDHLWIPGAPSVAHRKVSPESTQKPQRSPGSQRSSSALPSMHAGITDSSGIKGGTTHTRTRTCIYIYIYIYMYMHISIHIYGHIHAHMRVYIAYAHMYISYTHIHVYTRRDP